MVIKVVGSYRNVVVREVGIIYLILKYILISICYYVFLPSPEYVSATKSLRFRLKMILQGGIK